MTAKETKKRGHFCIHDYYLDGKYLKWEEITGECPVLVVGQKHTVYLENGTQITGEILETIAVSENERKIIMSSC